MLEQDIQLCSSNYQKWKNLALNTNNLEDARKAVQKALFWIELHSAYITLWSIEQARGENPEMKNKIILAKIQICKRLVDYAEVLLNEINI